MKTHFIARDVNRVTREALVAPTRDQRETGANAKKRGKLGAISRAIRQKYSQLEAGFSKVPTVGDLAETSFTLFSSPRLSKLCVRYTQAHENRKRL